MITIDGSQGEGGGQVLRTALGLSLTTGQPFTIHNIRAKRKKPGLLRQHLTAVKAAQAIGQAKVSGVDMGSTSLTFRPHTVQPGHHHFSVGTAGSATLVLQTILPALITASAPSALTLEGGTHNPMAPPFDFLQKTFLPLLQRMGPKVGALLDRPGFFPAGGGRFEVTIEPVEKLQPLHLPVKFESCSRRARAMVANLPAVIAEKELALVRQKLGWTQEECLVESVTNSHGPGNVLMLEIESPEITEVMTGFGDRGVKAAGVVQQATSEARRFLAAGVPVGEHLADQLLVPMALTGEGSFHTLPLSRHSQTNIETIQQFLSIGFQTISHPNRTVEIQVGS